MGVNTMLLHLFYIAVVSGLMYYFHDRIAAFIASAKQSAGY